MTTVKKIAMPLGVLLAYLGCHQVPKSNVASRLPQSTMRPAS